MRFWRKEEQKIGSAGSFWSAAACRRFGKREQAPALHKPVAAHRPSPRLRPRPTVLRIKHALDSHTPGINTFTRLLVSWPGAFNGPTRPTLSTGAGEVRMAFFLLLFLCSGVAKKGRDAGRLGSRAYPSKSTPWAQSPGDRLGAPVSTSGRQTPDSLIRASRTPLDDA